ncbi:MAG: peptidoglycan DD-metalloendopeptidase family protein [Alphaproteobacteria bacterium]|nr:peptidoglycan DD-metalloendopeptidase family protein [Alphaproteobacteria bacterium]
MHRISVLIDRLFPDRQLFVRANDHVRFVTLSRRTQLWIAGSSLLVAAWMVASSAMLLVLGRSLEARDARIDRQRAAYEKLLGDVSLYQDKVAQVTQSLRSRQAYLLGLFEQGQERESSAEGGSDAAAAGAAAGRQAEARAAFQRHVRQLDGELEAMNDMSVALEGNLADVRQRLAAAMAERDQVAAARADLWQRLEDAQRRERGEADRNSTLRDTLGRTLHELNQTADQRDRAVQERDAYKARYDELEHEVVEAQEQQQNLIYRLTERAADSVSEAERIVHLAGIKLGEIIPGKRPPAPVAQGGPFVPVGRSERPMEPTQTALALLDQQLDRWDTLHGLLRAMPFAPPLEDYTVSSSYGTRVDPFTQTSSQHFGIDLRAPRRTIIHAPAPGTVLFASRKDRYGKLIEIDHGMGIVTRYGHLDEMLVKPGDKVGFRTKIGRVGNTGRTSGSHLHYEIHVKGKPLDPARFLEVGRHLYKETDEAKVGKGVAKVAAKPAAKTASGNDAAKSVQDTMDGEGGDATPKDGKVAKKGKPRSNVARN